jgi:hypothetical protein
MSWVSVSLLEYAKDTRESAVNDGTGALRAKWPRLAQSRADARTHWNVAVEMLMLINAAEGCYAKWNKKTDAKIAEAIAAFSQRSV